MQHKIRYKNKQITITVNQSGRVSTVSIDGNSFSVENFFADANELKIIINGKPCTFCLARIRDVMHVFYDGEQYVFHDQSEAENTNHTAPAAGDGGNCVASPMPGTITKINCKEGDTVSENDTLVIVEAMKMENTLRSPASGTVSKVHNVQGELVEAGAPIVEIDVNDKIQ